VEAPNLKRETPFGLNKEGNALISLALGYFLLGFSCSKRHNSRSIHRCYWSWYIDDVARGGIFNAALLRKNRSR